MQVREGMSSVVLTIGPSHSLQEAARLMADRNVGAAVVVDPESPGPGIVTIIFGVGFLALEFDRAERWLERVIIWGDRTAERAEQTTTKQRVIAGIATAAAVAAFVVAAVLWDIPLMPVL